ncbi:ER membrane protein SH3-domain-containing protein [Naematelia encephala]|uniref:ER membrane protein SH3-domain-containing protein n=1 Tax=Naematelia encephala TaxID=71784 RepID=A0A1Y2ARR2_9TREE|nr:ER membrane protein SH3-domain-containing protein [Naematelia encephala]
MVWRTTLVTLTTCFLLGTTFTHWIADHNVLWRSPLTSDALQQSITYYSILATAPAGLGWVYVAVGVLALGSSAGRLWKDFLGKGGEVLFDGGSIVLLSAITYNQINELYPTISLFPSPVPNEIADHPLYPALTTAVRDLANDNVITAVMLTGVMALQAGRWYSKRPTSSPPQSETSSDPSSPSTQAVDQEPSTIRRSGTPYRELTQDEAMELDGPSGSASAEDHAVSPGRKARSRGNRVKR